MKENRKQICTNENVNAVKDEEKIFMKNPIKKVLMISSLPSKSYKILSCDETIHSI